MNLIQNNNQIKNHDEVILWLLKNPIALLNLKLHGSAQKYVFTSMWLFELEIADVFITTLNIIQRSSWDDFALSSCKSVFFQTFFKKVQKYLTIHLR